MRKDLNRHLSKEDIEYSTSLIIREMQIKTTMRCHPTLVRIAGEGMEKREHSCTVGGNINGTATVKNNMEIT